MNETTAPPETRTRQAEQLADRYPALWNEPDADRRQRIIAELWTADGSQTLQPPQARVNAPSAVSVPPGDDALPRRRTMYPTARSVRAFRGVLATAKA